MCHRKLVSLKILTVAKGFIIRFTFQHDFLAFYEFAYDQIHAIIHNMMQTSSLVFFHNEIFV